MNRRIKTQYRFTKRWARIDAMLYHIRDLHGHGKAYNKRVTAFEGLLERRRLWGIKY